MATVPSHKHEPFDNDNIPSLDIAEYLTRTILFHLSSAYHFDTEGFLQELRLYYHNRKSGQQMSSSLWNIRFLLVIAFGKLLLGRGVSTLQKVLEFYAL